MNGITRRIVILSIMLSFAGVTHLHALINPNFTPVHLTNQSSLILEIRITAAKEGKMTAEVQRVLKGKKDRKSLEFDLTTSVFPEHVKVVESKVNAHLSEMSLFFTGSFAEDGGGGAGWDMDDPAEESQRGFLHIAGTWVAFTMGKSCWEMSQLDNNMGTTWAGGTDMLSRAVEYIISDPDAVVPVREGVQWSYFNTFAKLKGTVRAAIPVDLAGDGKLTLYVACEDGDRLFQYDTKDEEVKDVTAAAKIMAKSKTAAWGDVNADGRMDLWSWDGKALTIHVQGADGVFKAGEKLPKAALPDDCLSLTIIDTGKTSVLINTKTAPVIWTPGKTTATPVSGTTPAADLGAPGICLIADFDNDTLPDILQLFEKGSLIYRGKATGRFEDAKRCPVALGAGITNAFMGDFDADGLLDLFTVSSHGASELWNNRGRFQFKNAMTFTGELAYKGGSGATGGMAGDFNNDGRQDIFFYYDNTSPRLYFNRGFRSFGLTNGMDISANGILHEAEEGQQAGCLMDLNGDGAQDMVLILKNGEAFAFYVEAGEGTALCVRAVLSPKGPYTGPMNVTGWSGTRCLGTWNVLAGTMEGFFGQEEAGPVLIKWQFPGGKPQQKEVIVEDVPVRFILAP